MKEENAVELLNLAVQISASKFTTAVSGKTNTDEVLGETLDVLVKHLKSLKKPTV